MTQAPDGSVTLAVGDGWARVPVSNLWLLYLYASSLYAHLTADERVQAENSPDDLVELAARILSEAADRRLRRSLSVGYVDRHEVVSAVRDRIDHLGTARGRHLERGRVLCSFTELSIDTPRNRYVAAALALAGRRLGRGEAGLARACLKAASQFERVGVQVGRPDPQTPRREVFGHYDREDRRLMAAAQLVVERLLPSHATGASAVQALDYSDRTLRKLFEDAVRGFYRANLPGWRVGARDLAWPSADALPPAFPKMTTDITLDRPDGTRLIIDTKFTSALSKPSEYHGERLKSGHLYQLYAYLRTQEGRGDSAADHASGLLLYPSTEGAPDVDVEVVMQGHTLRAATVDLGGSASEIRARLLGLASW